MCRHHPRRRFTRVSSLAEPFEGDAYGGALARVVSVGPYCGRPASAAIELPPTSTHLGFVRAETTVVAGLRGTSADWPGIPVMVMCLGGVAGADTGITSHRQVRSAQLSYGGGDDGRVTAVRGAEEHTYTDLQH